LKALYIGILTDDTTSRMRADTLRKITHELGADWDSIDTDQPFRSAPRLLKSMAFRLRSGPLVRQVNRRVVEGCRAGPYDLVWVDKGVYLWPETVAELRTVARQLVHYTPDTAFHANRSRHFEEAARQYDLLVTTKSFEMEQYRVLTAPERILLTTQAYDPALHRPVGQLQKQPVAAFIGLCEEDRERCIETLLEAGIPVRVGGRGWKRFARRHASNPRFHYLSDRVFGAEYVSRYAAAAIGLGLLSKRFPELHTTRTFEIPACGAALATERTAETATFFDDDEAIFFTDYDQLAGRLSDLLQRPGEVAEFARKGRRRVEKGGYDYESVLSGILRRLAMP
jgi:spore maturation protein CgeB